MLWCLRSPNPKADSRLLLYRAMEAEWGRAVPEALWHYGPVGKPLLPEDEPRHFSLSHTPGATVCLLGRQALGVDIEGPRDLGGAEHKQALAKRVCTPEERDWLEATTDPLVWQARFLRLWVLKESYCKATGEGLGAVLSRVAFRMEEPETPQGPSGWRFVLREPWPGSGYVVACCLREKEEIGVCICN